MEIVERFLVTLQGKKVVTNMEDRVQWKVAKDGLGVKCLSKLNRALLGKWNWWESMVWGFRRKLGRNDL